MDRNREARRVTMAASTNGLSSRRRHRGSSVRDSPEEDGGPAEMNEPGRLRDRVVKNRDRDRTGRNKRRRNRGEEGGDESSEESVNDEDEEEEDESTVRMLPPNHHQSGHVSGRKSCSVFLGSTGGGTISNSNNINNKVFRPVQPVQGWKPADEMIGFSVPRKARSASKRSHENWISGAAGADQIHRQASPSPAPPSPSSSNVSARKKMKPNGQKQKPPKSSTSKASSSNPEDLEIEIAEVLFGLMTQSQAPAKKEIESSSNNRQSNDSKSRVSSPISNSVSTTAPSSIIPPQNCSSSTVPLSAVAPKRKKPRQVSDNFGARSNNTTPISTSTVKLEIDQSRKIENSSPNSEKKPENSSFQLDFTGPRAGFASSEPPTQPLDSAAAVAPAMEVVETPAVKPEEDKDDVAVAKVNGASSEMEIQREEKFEIDLMAPPPQLRSSPERESEIDFTEHKPLVVSEVDAEKSVSKSVRDEMLVKEPELKKAKSTLESSTAESDKPKERNINLQLDLEKAEPESLMNKSHPHVIQKQHQPQLKALSKDENPQTDKTAQSSSLPLPMSLASWPGGLPPVGYMAPLQGVVSMDGTQVPTTPLQPLFSQPRPKRCATHCYIARNIHYLQQFMKMNPFWPAAAAAPVFGAKSCNLNVLPPTELHGRAVNTVQEKGQGLTIFPGKDKASSQPVTIADAQKKQQQILLQQALPPGVVPPSNLLHGPAFIFPFNQQQAAAAAAAAAASVRPGPAKSPNIAQTPTPASTSTPPSVNGSAPTAAAAAVTFNYPNLPSNETQYLAILQNNGYPFPIPAPNYRGAHPQPMPFFNGSFYTSQMIHPSQLQQQSSIQQGQQNNTSISSGSSSSQKQQLLQSHHQQRPQGIVVNGETGTSNLNNAFPAPKTRPPQSSQPQTQPHQARNLETEVGNEDSPSTADSRVSRANMSVYGQNYAMPMHHQNFAVVSSTPPPLVGSSNGSNNQGENKKQQQQSSQQQALKGGVDSLPQTFAMSFASISGGNSTPSIDLSSVAQNHVVLQNFPEAARQNYQIMQAAVAAQAAQQRKSFKVSEEGKSGGGGGGGGGGDSSNKMDDEKKGLSGKSSLTGGQQSIAFSKPDLTETRANVIDSSVRNMNLVSAPPQRGSRASISNVMGAVNSTNSQLQTQVQFQQQHMQQQMVQLQKQHQQLQQQMAAAARNKMPPMSSNGSVYGEHLSSSSPSASAKFQNTSSGFPQNLVQGGGNNSPSHSPQWKSSSRTNPQVQPSKNLPQQQARTQQSHTQISFGSSQKSQQVPTTHQASSPPMRVGSPTTSHSKGASGSPRTPSSNSQGNNKAVNAQPSSLSSQQTKNAASLQGLKSPSILGNPHNISSSNTATKSQIQQQQQQQQQLAKQMTNQPQLFFSPGYMQTQSPHSTGTNSSTAPSTASGYYLQRRYPEKQQQQQGSPSATSTGMLSLCSPVTLASTSTSDAKAAAASFVGNNMKGSGVPSQNILQHSQQQFSYVHSVPAAVQVKPTEQKQPAGNRECLTRK